MCIFFIEQDNNKREITVGTCSSDKTTKSSTTKVQQMKSEYRARTKTRRLEGRNTIKSFVISGRLPYLSVAAQPEMVTSAVASVMVLMVRENLMSALQTARRAEEASKKDFMIMLSG